MNNDAFGFVETPAWLVEKMVGVLNCFLAQGIKQVF